MAVVLPSFDAFENGVNDAVACGSGFKACLHSPSRKASKNSLLGKPFAFPENIEVGSLLSCDRNIDKNESKMNLVKKRKKRLHEEKSSSKKHSIVGASQEPNEQRIKAAQRIVSRKKAERQQEQEKDEEIQLKKKIALEKKTTEILAKQRRRAEIYALNKIMKEQHERIFLEFIEQQQPQTSCGDVLDESSNRIAGV